jgi:hypothetical protein
MVGGHRDVACREADSAHSDVEMNMSSRRTVLQVKAEVILLRICLE